MFPTLNTERASIPVQNLGLRRVIMLGNCSACSFLRMFTIVKGIYASPKPDMENNGTVTQHDSPSSADNKLLKPGIWET